MKKFILFPAITVALVLMFCLSGCKKKEVPVVETDSVTFVTGTSAVCGGKITDDGGETVISRGVCWSTNLEPTISDSKSPTGAGAGSFTCNVTNLRPTTNYFIRAYATNSSGTGYGMVMSFKTLGDIPKSKTFLPVNVTTSGANISGSINPNYLATRVSFEYGPTTTYGSSTRADTISGNVDIMITASISGLAPGTLIHYRIKAENSLGVTYGDDMTFTTLGLIPTAVTNPATNITTISAVLNGSVNANYLSTVVSFEYGTTTSYGTSVDATQSPLLTTTYSATVNKSVSGLPSGTIYHFRVKAVNALGTSYGNDLTFSTAGQIPTVTTLPVVSVTATSAVLKGTVNPNLLSTTITFEYGITSSYGSTINGNPNTAIGSSLYIISATPTGLIEGTTYHYRIKAVNSVGTSYGDDVTFTPSASSPLTDVEGNVYKTIQIGTQVWMAENLKTTKYNDGTSIPNVTDPAIWIALTSPSYRWYNDDMATYKSTYGALYNWFTVNTGKLCPSGWRVPSESDFTVFSDYLGGLAVAGAKIKETGYIHWDSPNAGATNETGFTALPAGNIDDTGNSISLTHYTWFWTSTLEGKPYYRSVGFEVSLMGDSNGASPQRGFSIRCLKN